MAVLGLAVITVPETVGRQPGALRSLTPTVSVPPSSTRMLRDVSGAIVASWGMAGLYLSLIPSVLEQVFDITNHFAAGAVIGLFAGCGALAGVLLRGTAPRRMQFVGLFTLVAGPVLTVTSIVTGTLTGVVVGTAIAGVGFGAGFQSGLRMLQATATPEHRAGLLSTIYLICYVSFGLPSLVAGLVDPYTGLVPAIVGYGVLVVSAAVVALLLQLRPGSSSSTN